MTAPAPPAIRLSDLRNMSLEEIAALPPEILAGLLKRPAPKVKVRGFSSSL